MSVFDGQKVFYVDKKIGFIFSLRKSSWASKNNKSGGGYRM